MQIHLWQQFSSNHSSSFTVIGDFATPEAAQHAAAELRRILQQIADWYAEAAQNNDAWLMSGQHADEPSPIEKALAEEYHIEWSESAIDWFNMAQIDLVFDRFIFMTPQHRPEMDGRPFDRLMQHWGGKGYQQGDIYGDSTGSILIDLTCDAPDEATAQRIYKHYLGYQKRMYCTGTQLRFDRWLDDDIEDFPAVLDDLKQQGCTNIELKFTQLDAEDDFGDTYGADDLDVMLDILRLVAWSGERSDAADLLGDIGDARAVEPLLTALAHETEGFVQLAIIQALGELGDQRAVAPLLKFLHANKPASLTVVTALGKLRDAHALAPLIAQLKHAEIWEQVALVLGIWGEDARLALEHALLTSRKNIRPRIIEALRLIQETSTGGTFLNDLRSGDDTRRLKAWQQVVAAHDLDTMLLYLDNPGSAGDYRFMTKVTDTLITYTDPRIVPALVKHVTRVGDHAIHALHKMGAEAVEGLLTLAETHPETHIRDSAFWALTYMGDGRTYTLMLAALGSADRIPIQMGARGLGNIGDKAALPALVEAFFRGGDNWRLDTTSLILEAIIKLEGLALLIEPLLARLNPNDSYANIGIVTLLGDIGDERARVALHELATTATLPMLQTEIQTALAKLEGKTGQPD